jgi:hypothetical protein
LESLRELVQGREFGGGEEGFRGAEEEPAFFAGCADDESRVLQRLESMAPVRALQFEKSSGGDRLQVRDQGQGFVGGLREEARLLVVGDDGLLGSWCDREAIPSLLFCDAESSLGVSPCESAEGRGDLRFAVLEEPDEFGDAERFWRQEEECFERALEVIRCRRRAQWCKCGREPASDGHARLRSSESGLAAREGMRAGVKR